MNGGCWPGCRSEAGPADGPPVLLLHGWPYDIHSFVDVAPILANAGHRVLIPYVCGYGDTRFLSSDTPRNAQPAAVATDANRRKVKSARRLCPLEALAVDTGDYLRLARVYRVFFENTSSETV